MDMRTDRVDDLPNADTPEDVAVLYSWANLHGAKYRDFSASRREYRAQLRHRAAEQVRESELQAKQEAEIAAENAEALAREAERAAQERQEYAAESSRLQALRQAEEAARLASAERIEAARRSEAAALAEAIARREEREIAEAHASARRQSARYAESERHRRELETEDSPAHIPGQISDPYTPLPQLAAHLASPSTMPVVSPPLHLEPVRMVPEPSRHDPRPVRRDARPAAYSSGFYDEDQAAEPPPRFTDEDTPPPSPPKSIHARGYRPDDASGVRRIPRLPEADPSSSPRISQPAAPSRPPQRPLTVTRPDRSRSTGAASSASHRQGSGPNPRSSERPAYADRERRHAPPRTASYPASSSEVRSTAASPSEREEVQDRTRSATRQADHQIQSPPKPPVRSQIRRESPPPHWPAAPETQDRDHSQHPRPATQAAAPAWLYESGEREAAGTNPPELPIGDTLQQSRERVASRWFALKGVFEQPGSAAAEPPPVRQRETRTPVLAVFSLAGGVGKTSLVATLGRSLSSLGEKVLLTDTTTHGLLPFYFGASELRHGAVRTFSPPSGSTDAPIYLVSYDADLRRNDEHAETALAEEITAAGRGAHRVLLDLNAASSWIVRRLARASPTILVPVAPDMNSVISLHTVEKLLADVTNADGQPAQTFFLLNHFDASLPLHLDVREVLRRQLGDRLLPFVIRRAPVVSEALAEGMTVVDYAADASVAEDYLHVADWLRTLAAPATAGFRNARWSER